MQFRTEKPLSKAQKENLQELLARLTKVITATERHHKAHLNYQAAMEKLERNHSKYEERAAAGDADASTKLYGLSDQRMRLTRTIQEHHNNGSDLIEPMRQAVNDAQQIMGAVCLLEFQRQLNDSLEAALAPYFHQVANARDKARDNDAIRAMGLHFNCPIGNSIPELMPLAQRYVEVFNHLLAHEAAWEFIPTHAAASSAAPVAV